MLSPECRQGDEEKDLLITVLISSDRDKQMQGGEDAAARAGKGNRFFLSLAFGEGTVALGK